MSQSWTDLWMLGRPPRLRDSTTVHRVDEMAKRLTGRRAWPDEESIYRVLAAADRLTSAAMWLVLHMGYALRVDGIGAPLRARDFRSEPVRYMGASLGLVPAFVGYLTANILSGRTRSWVMDQGRRAAAIEAVNALTGDVSFRQKGRYGSTQAGLSNLVADYCSCAIAADGLPSAPIGCAAGADTAGAVSGGGDPGFTESQYVHMPLCGESLVAFLSEDAFDDQRAFDGSPRWWRAEDCGLVTPVMIRNARGIEARSEVAESSMAWLDRRLRFCGFDPITIDGHDPAAFAWAILESEDRLKRFTSNPQRVYPAPLPYVIAAAEQDFGFVDGQPLQALDPSLQVVLRIDGASRRRFNAAAAEFFVPPAELAAALGVLQTHTLQGRPPESHHAIATRHPDPPILPCPSWSDHPASPMVALDAWFVEFLTVNPGLRPRVGSPDNLRASHMGSTLDRLCRRVDLPEAGRPESVDGGVIAARNADAVCGAVLANKGGLSLIVGDEALAMKMLSGLRQEIIFARHQCDAGTRPGWIAIPLIATHLTWETGGTDPSHQDPTLTEALMGEMSDTARVLFPIDANTAVAALRALYGCRGQIGCMVTPESVLPNLLDGLQAQAFAEAGAAHIAGDLAAAQVQFVAIGAYQLGEALKAHRRWSARGRYSCVTAILEPGRLREPRDPLEAGHVLEDGALRSLFPAGLPRVILSHTRPEPMVGLLRRLDDGPQHTKALGYLNRGGGLDLFGMLFANHCTWAHAADAAGALLKVATDELFEQPEEAALGGRGNPRVLADVPDAERSVS